MAATSAQPNPSGPQPGSVAAGPPPGATASGDQELATTDEVKEYCHEGEGEKINSMDLHDIKSELGKDAEESETPKVTPTTTTNPTSFNTSPNTSVVNPGLQFRPTVVQPMVYANGFMVPPFATGTPLYPVAAGIRPVQMEVQGSADWSKTTSGQGISIPYGYPTSFVSSLPVDQGLRPAAYPFLMSGQYVAQMSYPQQLTAFGATAAPNAAVQPHSGVIAPQQKEKKPHIKKPLNAFMLFMKEKRAEVIKECTLKESAAINQILGKKWHQLDKSEQAKYYEMAREERAKHMQMYPGWSARDNYAAHKKRRKKRQKQQTEEGNNKLMSEQNSEEVSENTSTECEGHLMKQKAVKVEDNLKDSQDNLRKCRARFGMDQQHMWCNPCRRKKKCIRADDDISSEKCKVSNDETEDLKPDQSTLKLALDNNSS